MFGNRGSGWFLLFALSANSVVPGFGGHIDHEGLSNRWRFGDEIWWCAVTVVIASGWICHVLTSVVRSGVGLLAKVVGSVLSVGWSHGFIESSLLVLIGDFYLWYLAFLRVGLLESFGFVERSCVCARQ